MRGFERSSVLAAPPEVVWSHATSFAGVNRELFPLARMTHPRGLERLDGAGVALGQRLLRSWVLGFGVLPIDYDDLTFVELEPGRRFLEHSRMLTQREWRHERVIEPAGAGSRVVDRVRFVPRIAALGALHQAVFGLAFTLRHANLRRIFGQER